MTVAQWSRIAHTAPRYFRVAALCTFVPLLSACAKTVEWKEEVALNTGDTIWVARSVVYSLQGGAGNPLDMRYRPKRNEVIEFEWKGRKYRYEGDARVMVLAIAPDGRPVLVAKAADNSWDAVHRYACTVPYYVELIPQADGQHWTWPARIDEWLYGVPKNLLLTRLPPNQMRPQYTIAAIRDADTSAMAGRPPLQKIDPDYVGDVCRQQRRK